MNIKGFTLVELLAVIVILAIILAIAIPSISSLIASQKERAFVSDAQMIIKAIEYKTLENDGIQPDIDENNILSELNIDDDNYEEISVSKDENEKIYLKVIGKNKWAGLVACGTYNSIKVDVSDFCTSSDFVFVGELKWVNSFGGSFYDTFNDVIGVDDGYIAVGESDSNNFDLLDMNKGNYDAIVVKYDNDGNVVWKKTFGGSSYDSFKAITKVSDGYIVAGNSYSTDSDLTGIEGQGSAIIVKYDIDWNITWFKNFGGSSSELFKDIIATPDGYVAVGYSWSQDGDLEGLNNGCSDAIIVKFDLNGNILWNKNFGGTEWDEASYTESFRSVVMAEDGYVAVGRGISSDGDMEGIHKGWVDGIIVKYDFDGNVVWKKTFGGTSEDDFFSIVSVSDGYVAVGYSWSQNEDLEGLNKGNGDAIIVRYDLNGNILWNKNFGGTSSDYFSDIIVNNNGYMTSGWSMSNNNDLEGKNKGNYDGIIAEFDLNGNLMWNENFGGTSSDYFSRSAKNNTGYAFVGSSLSSNYDLEGKNKGDADATIFSLE